MMMKEIDRIVYYYIIEIEVMLLMKYKIDPFSISDRLTISDIQSYVEIIGNKEEEQNKSIDKKGIWGSLMGIRDILNVISYKK